MPRSTDADAADARVAAANGEELPPLLGVPCTIKESIRWRACRNTAGVVARRGHIRATETAPTAARLLAAARSRSG